MDHFCSFTPQLPPHLNNLLRLFLSSWAIFCPFTTLTVRKMKISKKWKIKPGGIVTIHKCTKNHDHRLYCSSDMARDGCNFYFSFWAIFCPFTPLTARKMKIWKNWKKHLEISSFYTSVPKIMMMLYCSWDMARDTCNFYFSFWPNFCPFTPLTPQKIKI